MKHTNHAIAPPAAADESTPDELPMSQLNALHLPAATAENAFYILQNVKGAYRPVNWFWDFSGKIFGRLGPGAIDLVKQRVRSHAKAL